ncbi:MAG: isoleucine--tRNA ligase [Planctomycetes bacterium]|nr:isoleucine--tRNA ligase [Planctomycetota bacterium]
MYQEFSGEKRQQTLEDRVLERWREKGVFQAAVDRRADAPRFTFYEGPPTANGRPGIHHVLARTLKDVICRYRDLSGFNVERKAGWDTHGLPVEVEVEKTLGIHGKEAIQQHGVESFTKKCIESVFTYTEEWEKLTDRIGYWLDLEHAYVTYHESYVESVWWALAELYKKDLLYRGHKVVWWWPQGGTALSAAEVGLGYREVQDPSVTVRFRLSEDVNGKPASILAWTTTPWTLPSNCALAVGAALDYVAADLGDEILIVAEALAEKVLADRERTIVDTFKGATLVGRSYTPLFDFKTPEDGSAHVVIAGDFVSTDSGTGIVHLAPGFGEDDTRVCREEGVGFLQLVQPDGAMTAECGAFAGMYVKDADKHIIRDLDTRGLLFDRSQYTHDYPFCWRAQEDPLIQYARKSWFIKTTSAKDRLMELNRSVNWYPDNIKEGRFGDFLRNNVDWALSRERFWGTPLPIWINDETGTVDCIGSVQEILDRNPDAFAPFEAARKDDPSLSDHLRVHKPWIDDVTWTKDGESGVYRRVKDVIDCWFDSGAMPFAQRHYPFEDRELFESSFPADFICEGLDQTRGWFYSLLAIGTLLFDETPYKNVIVNGLVNDKHGKKMSKSVGNTVPPWEVIEAHGADPLRWYLLAGSPPWLPKSFDTSSVGEVSRKVFGTLWPSYNFFALYAGIDEWTPGSEAPPVADRPATDRWLLSRTHSLTRDFRDMMENYDPMRATRMLGRFIIDELSNWYIRRNRARFWKSTDASDKAAAYDTLFHALETIAFLLAPIAPMSADALYLALHPRDDGLESVHLGDLPQPDESLIDEVLERRMAAILEVVRLGRAARETARIGVRRPLPRLVASGPDREALDGLLEPELGREVKEELNVKELLVVDKSGEYCTVTLKPNLPVLGPRYGKKLGKIRAQLSSLGDEGIAAFETDGSVTLEVDDASITLGSDDLLVERSGREGFAVAADGGYMAALDTTLTPELISEGLAREVINRVQTQRKQMDLDVTTRIRLAIHGPSEVLDAVRTFEERIGNEVLAVELMISDTADGVPGDARDAKVDDHDLKIGIAPADG